MNRTTFSILVKPAFLSLILLFTAMNAFSISAVVHKTSGKVELKVPGGSWKAAKTGMELGGGTKISTGFNSEAVIRIGESTLEIESLTRMSLESLIEKDDSIDTDLHLDVGKLKADVKSSEGLRNNFRVRSPQSTAAVRGTSFEYDGYTVTVDEGAVSIADNLGRQETAGAGLSAGVSGGNAAPSSTESAATGGGGGGAPSGGDSYDVGTGAVTGGGSISSSTDDGGSTTITATGTIPTTASVTISIEW